MTGVDTAAFAVALTDRLRCAGAPVSQSAAGEFARALVALPPTSRDRLYWAARLTLVRRQSDLSVFDEVFSSVFGPTTGVLGVRRTRTPPSSMGTTTIRAPGSGMPAPVGLGRGWADAAAVGPAQTRGRGPAREILDSLPAAATAVGGRPFAPFDEGRLRDLREWLETVTETGRRSRRTRPHPAGRRIALRETMARSRRTGWEPLRIVHTRRVVRPRPVVLVCDVSRSMVPFVDRCLHLMRVTALHGRVRGGVRARVEVFAFSTRLTRLTAVLAHRSAEAALAHANRAVVDRFGGTHIAGSLRVLLASHHGNALRGAVVVIVSDGWDADPPSELAVVMARIRRRAHRVIWLNPRVDAPGYLPLVGSMAAALPYVDDLRAAP